MDKPWGCTEDGADIHEDPPRLLRAAWDLHLSSVGSAAFYTELADEELDCLRCPTEIWWVAISAAANAGFS